VHIVLGDVARGGHVPVNIRRFTGIPFKTLDELRQRAIIGAVLERIEIGPATGVRNRFDPDRITFTWRA
jgi:hypothetical protein